MKKLIITALKDKYEGVSEQILGRIAERLAKTTTNADDAKTAVEGVTFQQILESYGDSRATEAQQTAVRNYEQKYGLKEGKAITGGEPNHQNPGSNQQDDTPIWAKNLLESNKALAERLAKLETERTQTSRKTRLNAELGKLPELYRKGYERASFDKLSDEEFDDVLTQVKAEVETLSKEINAKGAVFGQPKNNIKNSGMTPNLATEAEVDAVVGKLI